MPVFKIKNKVTDSIIFKLKTSRMQLCVEAAIKSGADLSNADLSNADLSNADLSNADLSDADLYRANLSRANLYSTNLSGADLPYANLSNANLSNADLSNADLYSTNLSGANLYRAYLPYANLSNANLYRANLSSAKNAELIIAKQKICPQEGAFIGFKKLQGGVIAKLVIPHDAERINALGSRKCRASKVFVYELFGANEAYDIYTGKTLYKQGCEVLPNKFDPDIKTECSNGIHFFITREEAEAY